MKENKEEFIHFSVGELISLLQKYPKDMIVTDEENRNFIHIVNRNDDYLTLSVKHPIGNCKRCGNYVYEAEDKDYPSVCPNCDENMYLFEINKFNNLDNGSK